jgi:two-component system, NtrC family, sensor kinase
MPEIPLYPAEVSCELLILDSLPAGVCGLDEKENITFCNSSFSTLIGLPRQEILGKNLHDLLHAGHNGHPAHFQPCALAIALARNNAVHGTDEYLWRKDGTRSPLEYWLQPLPDPATSTARVITLLEITERRAAEDALRASEERFRLISNNVGQVFYLMTAHTGTPVYLSPAFEKLWGLPCNAIYEKPSLWWRTVLPEDREQVLASRKRLLAGEQICGEFRIARPDGTRRWIKDQANPIHDSGGKVCMFAGVAEDITEAHGTREAIRQNEEKYRRLLANVPDVIWTSDQHRRIAYISPNVENLFGYNQQEVCSSPNEIWQNRIHPEDRNRVLAAYDALFSEQRAFNVEYRIQRKEGPWVWVHARAVRTHQQNGIVYADGLFSDITERRLAEEELRSKTAFLEAQANSTVDGILVVDEQGHKILQNQRLMEIFEVPQQIVQDKRDKVLLQHVVGKVKNPEQFLSTVTYLYAHRHETRRDEIELTNGTVLDRYSSPVIGEQGRYYGRIWTFRDVTERKRNEDALQVLSLAVEQSPASVVITDPQANITYVNRRFTECTGYSREEVLGKNPRVLKSGFSPPQVYKNLWETITRGGEWRGEFQNKKKNGELYWEAVAITPIKSAKEGITHYLALTEDISERKSMESQLRQAQKLEAIGQLAAGIAHEINTPTQFVTDNLMFLRDSWKTTLDLVELYRRTIQEHCRSPLPEAERVRVQQAEQAADIEFIAAELPRAVEQALDGARRVAKIVRAMKEFSHPDTGEKTAADLNRAIETTLTVARNEWKYVAEMETILDERLPQVPCQIGEFNQVILNLIVNAAHAIKEKVKDGEKGVIRVCTRTRGDFVEIAITDTGTGIPEAHRSRVFDPFFTTKEVGKGTGQGLSLAYNIIVKKHGGKIWFETETGKGTTFFLHLPITPPRRETEQA